jgi:hypothetical protein
MAFIDVIVKYANDYEASRTQNSSASAGRNKKNLTQNYKITISSVDNPAPDFLFKDFII